MRDREVTIEDTIRPGRFQARFARDGFYLALKPSKKCAHESLFSNNSRGGVARDLLLIAPRGPTRRARCAGADYVRRAARDRHGPTRRGGQASVFEVEDVDGDGMISFEADLVQLRIASAHISSGSAESMCIKFVVKKSAAPTPFLVTGTAERVITQWNNPPTTPLTLGQSFSVVNGKIPGFDAVVYLGPGTWSSADVIDIDLTTLPLFTGSLEVGGLLRMQSVPEPSGLALLATAAGGWGSLRFFRRKRARVCV